MRRRWLPLLLILAGAAALRIPCLEWGLPPSIPQVAATGFRTSYAIDEDDVISAASFTDPAHFDFDPKRYIWGTFHIHLLTLWMEALGGSTWRQAYYQMWPGAFERVYAIARLLSVVMGLAVVLVSYLLARDFADHQTGLWTAALVAVSPVELLVSLQTRVDVTAALLLALAFWLAFRKQPASAFPIALLAGLATAAKYSSVIIAGAIFAAVAWNQRFRVRTLALLAAGLVAGFLIGQPYVLTRYREMFAGSYKYYAGLGHAPPQFRMLPIETLAEQVLRLGRFGVGLVALPLACYGFWRIARRREPRDWVLLATLAGGLAMMTALEWPLLRYELPLIPFVSLAAAMAIVSLPVRARWVIGTLAIIPPLLASVEQVRFMRSPHPVNQVLAVILRDVPPGTPIARLVADVPPLDRRQYPMTQNPLTDDMRNDPPPWILLMDSPEPPYPETTENLVRNDYDLDAAFHTPPRFAWFYAGVHDLPHDWKYTNPAVRLYRRKR